MNYVIIQVDDLVDLELKVSRNIGLGWKPSGSLVVYTVPGERTVHFIQPMIKEDPH